MKNLLVVCMVAIFFSPVSWAGSGLGAMFKSSGRGAGMAEVGLGMGAGSTKLDKTYDFTGAAGYVNAGFGGLVFFNVGTSIVLRDTGGEKDLNYADYNYNDITVAWLGLGLNFSRLILNIDFAFGDARHAYQAGGQSGTDYTKDKITNLSGYRAAVILVPFTWGKSNSITITAQRIELTADDYTRYTYVNEIVTSKTVFTTKAKASGESVFLSYMKTF